MTAKRQRGLPGGADSCEEAARPLRNRRGALSEVSFHTVEILKVPTSQEFNPKALSGTTETTTPNTGIFH
jgi:hypothetical protein